MSGINLLLTAFYNLSANTLRSCLTVLGVIIGVAAVIASIAVARGTEEAVSEAIERFGTNLLYVSPHDLSEQERRQFAGRSKGLTYEDALTLKARILSLQESVPFIHMVATLTYKDREMVIPQLEATTPTYQGVRNFYVERGRFLTEEDMKEWKRVAVIGQEVVEKLFDQEDPIGKEVKINAERFTVVGVMEKKGIYFGSNYDEKVFIPITTAMRRVTGTDGIHFLLLKTNHRDDFEQAMKQAKAILTQRHNGVVDFRIRAQEEFRRVREQMTFTFMWMIRAIAVISLLVGGIGIMNIMLVTVTERTREIGLRKAVGATQRDILQQFLTEAVVISLMGGIIGIAVGISASDFMAHQMTRGMPQSSFAQSIQGDVRAIVTPSAIWIAFSFSVAVGIFFGFYPAWRAARLDPADALRLEL